MGHDHQDRVSMEMATLVASELPRRPEWIELARANLRRWKTQNADAPGLMRCYNEWEAILQRSVQDVCAELIAPTDRGRRVRQNSPFAGALSPQTVWAIKDRLRNEATTT